MNKFTIIICLLFLVSCYNAKKAQQQFSKAALNYPSIPANFCANTYPIKDTILKGDTILTFDTLYLEGASYTDTVTTKDTVRITTTITQPAKVITKTIYKTDTVIKENTAKIQACELDKNTLIGLLKEKTDEYNKMKHSRNTWRGIAIVWMLIAIGLLIKDGLILFFKIKLGGLLK